MQEAPADARNRPKAVIDDMTVVIPTLGRRMLLDCLRSLRDSTAVPAMTIVVDQGWNTENAAAIRALSDEGFPVQHLRSNDRGRARGLNAGLKHVTTRYVAVTDDDCLVDRCWLERARKTFDRYPGAVVTGRVVLAADATPAAFDESGRHRVWKRRSLKLDPLSGGNMAMPVIIIERVGFFDEDARLSTAEDCEWSYRALRLGIPIVYNDDMIVVHRDWRNDSERRAQFASYARSHGAYYGKHLRRGDCFILLRLLVHEARALKRWISGLLTGNSHVEANGRAYFLGLLPGMKTTLWNRSP